MNILLIDTHLKDDGHYGGIGYYRFIKPKQYLEPLGMRFEMYDRDNIDDSSPEAVLRTFTEYVGRFDAVVSKANTNHTSLSAMLMACTRAGTRFITDLDDNFMEILPTQPAWDMGFQKGDKERAVLGTQVSMSDALFVSTEPLKEYFSKIVKEIYNEDIPIYVLPNGNDLLDWQFKSPKNTKKTVIGWMGSITHDQDLALALPDIARLMDDYDDVHFQVMGGATEKTFKGQTFWTEKSINKVHAHKGTKSWRGFPETLMSARWDIGIAPLTDCEFNRAKSHIKWMEYTMKGIPTVASAVYPYVEAIEHEKTGLLVASDWYGALERLVKGKEFRKTLADNAYEEVKEKHQYKDLAHKWHAAFRGVANAPKRELFAVA